MAEQEGTLPFTGKLGDTVGYRRGSKYFKRAKPASYQPTAESQKSGAEFGAGSKATALLKSAFSPLILRSFKFTLHNRLAGKLRQIIRTGPVANKGQRAVFDGNLSLLKGFQLHPRVGFFNLCAVNFSSQITASQIHLRIPAFSWTNSIKAPKTADRVKIGLCCVFADFNAGSDGAGNFESINVDHLTVEKDQNFPGASFSLDIPVKQELAVLLVMNVFFEADSSGKSMIVDNQNFQAGLILDVAHLKDGALVEFVAEKPSEKPEKPAFKPDAFWKLDGSGGSP
ncbi:MAG TPA: hypothetical protein VL125_03510 [Pelobium sp.]|nr:hypothetical protein [Pelobium sp.]